MSSDILYPDGAVKIGGERVTVREFTFGETLRLEAMARPIVDAIASISSSMDDYEAQLQDAIAENYEAFLTMMAVATDKPEAWIEGLSQQDGDLLVAVFWEVNRDFFFARAGRKAQRAQRSATSSSSSSPVDTIPGGTHAVN